MIARGLVQQGDNIITLAARLLGDARRWPDLVKVNALRAPYVADVGRPGVLAPGDPILYPTGTDVPNAPDPRRVEAKTYFRDLALTRRGDVVLGPRGLRLVEGYENLEGALRRRLTYFIGSHPFHPTWGSRLKLGIGDEMDEARLSIVASDARRALRADPRVVDATVEAFGETDEVRLFVEVTPVPPGTFFSFEYLLSRA